MTAERLTVDCAAGQLATAKAVVRFVWEHDITTRLGVQCALVRI